jgi:hypothetical protein
LSVGLRYTVPLCRQARQNFVSGTPVSHRTLLVLPSFRRFLVQPAKRRNRDALARHAGIQFDYFCGFNRGDPDSRLLIPDPRTRGAQAPRLINAVRKRHALGVVDGDRPIRNDRRAINAPPLRRVRDSSPPTCARALPIPRYEII